MHVPDETLYCLELAVKKQTKKKTNKKTKTPINQEVSEFTFTFVWSDIHVIKLFAIGRASMVFFNYILY